MKKEGAAIRKLRPKHKEKRLFCRMTVTADLTYNIVGDNTSYNGQCRNLSHSGIQFKTGKLLEKGGTLEITIDTKSEKYNPMNVKVKILRIEVLENNEYKVSGKILGYI